MQRFDDRKSIAYIAQSSLAAHAETQRIAPGIRARVEPAIECLLKFIDCVGMPPPGEPEGVYQWWAQSAYLSVGHTSVALLQLLSGAFYLEAAILLRHMTEVLVQLRYFARHKDVVLRHMTAKAARDRVAFKTMFEEICPGYYAEYYSLASGFAHGGVAAAMLRLNFDEDPSQPPIFGCQFSTENCTLVGNTWVAVLHGFLVTFPSSFPNMNADQEARSLVASARIGLEEYLQAHWAENEKARAWLRVLGQLVEWRPPEEAA